MNCDLGFVMGFVDVGVVLLNVGLLVVQLDAFLIYDFGHVIHLLGAHWALALVPAVSNFGGSECKSCGSCGFGHGSHWLGHPWHGAVVGSQPHQARAAQICRWTALSKLRHHSFKIRLARLSRLLLLLDRAQEFCRFCDGLVSGCFQLLDLSGQTLLL